MQEFTVALADLRTVSGKGADSTKERDFSRAGIDRLLRRRLHEEEEFRGLRIAAKVYLRSILARVNLVVLDDRGTLTEHEHWAGYGGSHWVSYSLVWNTPTPNGPYERNITLTVYVDRMAMGQANGDPPTKLISIDSPWYSETIEQWLVEVLTLWCAPVQTPHLALVEA